jgi:glycosyltransferase involved in cell wall biosynthesis
MKKILIKVTTIFKPRTGLNRYVSGIGRSTIHLLEALAKSGEKPFEIDLYGSGITSLRKKAYDLPFDYGCFPLPMKLGTVWTRLEPWYLKYINKHDLLHIPHNYDYALTRDMNFVITMHDTCEYDAAEKAGNLERMDVWKLAAEGAKKIVTCSSCSKADIIDRFDVPEEKVVVIPWGISTDVFHKINNNDVAEVLRSKLIDDKYFLAVSCSNERKNIGNLLEAYRNFLSIGGDVQMVLLWGTPPQNILAKYSKEIRGGKIKFLDYVTDRELVCLYNGAIATMYPSRYEGFGFPILESFACGTPVMTCNNSSLSDVGGDVAVYVGEDNIDEMTQAMQMFSDGTYNMEEFEIKAAQHVKEFSWDLAARKYVNFYKDVLEEV